MSEFIYHTEEGPKTVDYSYQDERLLVEGESFPCDGSSVWLDGRQRPFRVHRSEGLAEVWLDGELFRFEVVDPRRRDTTRADAGSNSGRITTSMPGKVLQVHVKVGQEVEKGQQLFLMESMKMELSLDAPFAGTVTEVSASAGEMVALGQQLALLEPSP